MSAGQITKTNSKGVDGNASSSFGGDDENTYLDVSASLFEHHSRIIENGDELTSPDDNSSTFYDAAGQLKKESIPMKMNLDDATIFPSLGYCSSSPVVHHTAESAVLAMEAHAKMAQAAATFLTNKAKAARLLYETQNQMYKASKNDDNNNDDNNNSDALIAMSASMRELMNQSRMKEETLAVALGGFLGGIYLPRSSVLLLTHGARPNSYHTSQNYLSTLDVVLEKLQSGSISVDNVDSMDAATAKVFGELRRTGNVAALLKQMRGSFSKHNKREDNQHSIFVTASLREQFIHNLTLSRMQILRRINPHQFLLQRTLVAMERFLDLDANGTVKAWVDGNGTISALMPSNPLDGAQIMLQDENDYGGPSVVSNQKILRIEEKGIGVFETEEILASSLSSSEIREKMHQDAVEEYEKAKQSSLSLNITQNHSVLELCENRELATSHISDSDTPQVDFVRQNLFLYVTHRAHSNTERELVEKDHSSSAVPGKRAPKIKSLLPAAFNDYSNEDAALFASAAIADAVTVKKNRKSKQSAVIEQSGPDVFDAGNLWDEQIASNQVFFQNDNAEATPYDNDYFADETEAPYFEEDMAKIEASQRPQKNASQVKKDGAPKKRLPKKLRFKDLEAADATVTSEMGLKSAVKRKQSEDSIESDDESGFVRRKRGRPSKKARVSNNNTFSDDESSLPPAPRIFQTFGGKQASNSFKESRGMRHLNRKGGAAAAELPPTFFTADDNEEIHEIPIVPKILSGFDDSLSNAGGFLNDDADALSIFNEVSRKECEDYGQED